MGTRILGGVAGWLLGIVPLLAVDGAGYFGIASFPDPVVAGALAVAIGLLLGGITAGLIGGRSQKSAGGAAEAGVTGIVAATLYAVSIVGMMEVARAAGTLSPTITENALQTSIGVLFLAALLVLVALVTGYLTGRPAGASTTAASARMSQASTRDQPANSARASRPPSGSRPGGQAYGQPPYTQPRYGDAAPPSRPMGSRPGGMPGQSPDASDPRYAGARVYGSPSRPARGPESNPNRR